MNKPVPEDDKASFESSPHHTWCHKLDAAGISFCIDFPKIMRSDISICSYTPMGHRQCLALASVFDYEYDAVQHQMDWRRSVASDGLEEECGQTA